jgi:hypothetical protein
MYYIEFIEPKEGVDQRRFHDVVRRTTERWAADHPEDKLLLNIGRTWRLGPRPSYMTIWEIAGFETMSRWTREFQEAAVLENHAEFTDVATIVDAGVYEDLGNEVW